jgi:hypothetical protein
VAARTKLNRRENKIKNQLNRQDAKAAKKTIMKPPMNAEKRRQDQVRK